MSSAIVTQDLTIDGNRVDFDWKSEEITAGEWKQCETAARGIFAEIMKLNRMGIERSIVMGKHFERAHRVLSKKGTGTWGRWLKSIGVNRMVAHRAMKLFEAYGQDKETAKLVAENFNVDAALLAAHEKTPDDVLESCLTVARTGERVTKPIVEGFMGKPELEDKDNGEVVDAADDDNSDDDEQDWTDDAAKKLANYLARMCKDWTQDDVGELPTIWSKAHKIFIEFHQS